MSDLKKILLFASVATPVGTSLFLLGGVYSHTGTNLIVMLITSILSILFLISCVYSKDKFDIPPIVIPLLLIIAYALIQLIPLSHETLKLITPTGAFFRALGPGNKGPVTMSIPDTFYSILRIATLILFSITVSNIICCSEKWKSTVLKIMVFFSTWAIFVSFILRIVHAESWLYGKLYRHGFLMDPVIINPNHAAGFFGVSAFILLAVIYKTETSRMRFFYSAIFFLHCIAVISTLSRAGIASFVSALLLLAVMNKFSTGSFLKHRTVIFFIAFSFITVIYSGHSYLSREFDFYREGYFNKISNIAEVHPYFKDFIITGSGLGSFSKVFTYYQADPETRFTQLENEPLQFILETGLPFALLIFGFLIWLFYNKTAVFNNSNEKNSLIVLLYFVVAHNMLDFNFHNFSTLFPVIIAATILLKPVTVTGQKKNGSFIFMLLMSVAVISAISFAPLRTLTGYEGDLEYDKAVYFYPADYSIPFEESIRRINSRDKGEAASAGYYISDAVAKSPRYYYSYYVAGTYMLKNGAEKQAVTLYRKSALLSGKKLSFLLTNVLRHLKTQGLENKIIEVIPFKKENREQIERFLRSADLDEKTYNDIVTLRKDLFFISNLRTMVQNNMEDEALEFIEQLKRSEINISKKERGEILILKGDIARRNKKYREAFDLYLEGAEITGNFSDHLRAARAALFLGEKEISVIENKLRKQSFRSIRNGAQYHKWLSEKEFSQNSFLSGINHLKKAVELDERPGWIFELYRQYNRHDMLFEAKKSLELLIRNHPQYRKELIVELLEKVKEKITSKKEKAYKEKLIGK